MATYSGDTLQELTGWPDCVSPCTYHTTLDDFISVALTATNAQGGFTEAIVFNSDVSTWSSVTVATFLAVCSDDTDSSTCIASTADI